MTPSHAVKRSKRYRYYVSASLLAADQPQARKGMRVPAGDIEGLALDRLRMFFASRSDVVDALAPLDLDVRVLEIALRNASHLSQRWLAMSPFELMRVVREVVARISIAIDRIEIRLSRTKIGRCAEGGRDESIARSRSGGRYRSMQRCDAPAKGAASSSRTAATLTSTLALSIWSGKPSPPAISSCRDQTTASRR